MAFIAIGKVERQTLCQINTLFRKFLPTLLTPADIIGTSLSGHADETAAADPGPDPVLIRRFHVLDTFMMAEGRLNTPALLTQAMQAGADAATVGTALTRLEVMTCRFGTAVLAGKE